MKKKNWIVVALCIAIVGMGIGFAALAQNLQINATANITGEWDIRIIDIAYATGSEFGSPYSNPGATAVGTPTFDGTSATFEVDLAYPGAEAHFVVRVENKGNIDAILSSITGIEAANNTAPLEIQISNVAMPIYPDSSPLKPGVIIPLGISIRWVANPDGETTIPDEKSKTFTIHFNFVQYT